MRKYLLIALLATTVATPAFAQDRRDRRENRAEEVDTSSQEPGSQRSERRESRRSSDDGQSQARAERVRPVMRERPQEMSQQPDDVGRRNRGGDDFVAPSAPAAGDTVRNWRRGGGGSAGSVSPSDSADSVRNWRGRSRRADSPSEIQERNLGVSPEERVVDRRSIEERNQRRFGDGGFDRNVRTTPGFGGRVRRMGNNVPVEGSALPPVSTELSRRGATSHRWSHGWRRDGRYDWRRYRDRNRSRFSIGFYFDPFGWNYRRYNVGYRMWPNYYRQDYWLNDPWQYRLPPAYGPYRWVRYHNDAILVNIYTGSVEDVIYNFFW